MFDIWIYSITSFCERVFFSKFVSLSNHSSTTVWQVFFEQYCKSSMLMATPPFQWIFVARTLDFNALKRSVQHSVYESGVQKSYLASRRKHSFLSYLDRSLLNRYLSVHIYWSFTFWNVNNFKNSYLFRFSGTARFVKDGVCK